MEVLVSAFSVVVQLAGLGVEVYYVWHTGKMAGGVLIGWVLTVGCVFLASVILPNVLAHGEYRHLFPEEIAIAAVVFMGWLPALGVGLVARRCRNRKG